MAWEAKAGDSIWESGGGFLNIASSRTTRATQQWDLSQPLYHAKPNKGCEGLWREVKLAQYNSVLYLWHSNSPQTRFKSGIQSSKISNMGGFIFSSREFTVVKFIFFLKGLKKKKALLAHLVCLLYYISNWQKHRYKYFYKADVLDTTVWNLMNCIGFLSISTTHTKNYTKDMYMQSKAYYLQSTFWIKKIFI